jgi:hypothetical protein
MATESGAAAPRIHTGVRVLVVDDDEAVRQVLRGALEDEGYTVIEAPDGVVALDILRAVTDPMVVITDHNMPRLDGPGLFSILPGLVNVRKVAGRSRAKARSGWAAKERRAAAMWCAPRRWMRVSARLRRAAMSCGAWPVRRRERSSPKVTSRT